MNERTVDDVLVEFGLARHTRYRCPSETECGHVWPCPTRRLAAALAAVVKDRDTAEAMYGDAEAALGRICEAAGVSVSDAGRMAAADAVIAALAATEQLKAATTIRPRAEWHEEIGDVLWWRFPIEEAPYCGTPMHGDFPEYCTHWTPIETIAAAIMQLQSAPSALRCNPNPQEHGGE